MPRTIAIDGPAGSGKTSVSTAVARDLGYLFVDTGAFYRAVTLAAYRAGSFTALDTLSAAELQNQVIRIAECSTFDINKNNDAQLGDDFCILLDGEDVTQAVRDPDVETYVSRVAMMSGVRAILNQKYRQLAERGHVIMAGRDIGSVVLPFADLKIFLDASVQTRARRRYEQRIANGQLADYEQILAAMQARDTQDSQRASDPLIQPDDAVYLVTDRLDIQGTIAMVKRLIEEWQPRLSFNESGQG